jgi:hypothetical protein
MSAPSFTYEKVREDDGSGDLGAVMGFNVSGHLDDRDIEVFLAGEVSSEWFDEGTPRGFDVSHCWVRKVPRDFGHAFQYQDHAGPGAKAVTYFVVETTWEKRCWQHPFDVAHCGVHKETLIGCDDIADAQGYVYMCRPCSKSYDERLALARAAALRSAS